MMLLLLTSQFVAAQSKTGTTIAQFLLIEPSARLAGMGNAGAAVSDEIMAAYYNPGAIGYQNNYGVQFTHSLWLADISYNFAAAAIPAGGIGNLFVSLTSLNSGEMDVRTVEQPLGTGERYSASSFALGLGLGRQLTDRFSVGFQLSYIQETIWHSSLNTFAINLGTIYEIIPDGLRLGAGISNFGLASNYQGRDLRIEYDLDPSRYGDNSSLPGILFTEDYPLPVIFRVGLGLPVKLSEQHDLLLAVNAYHPNDNTESMSFGAEWLIMQTMALRLGYQNLFLQDSEVGLTLGAGVKLRIAGSFFHFDYAWADHGRLENTQRFTLGFIF